MTIVLVLCCVSFFSVFKRSVANWRHCGHVVAPNKNLWLETFSLRPRPRVSGDFCIRKFFYADTKISASTRSVYESYTTVHTYPIHIRTSQRISQQSSRGKRLVLILWRQRIQKYTDTSVHTYPDTQRIQKFPLFRVYTEISGYTERIRRTRVDARCIRIKKFVDSKISGYVWTGPHAIVASSWEEVEVCDLVRITQKDVIRTPTS